MSEVEITNINGRIQIISHPQEFLQYFKYLIFPLFIIMVLMSLTSQILISIGIFFMIIPLKLVTDFIDREFGGSIVEIDLMTETIHFGKGKQSNLPGNCRIMIILTKSNDSEGYSYYWKINLGTQERMINIYSKGSNSNPDNSVNNTANQISKLTGIEIERSMPESEIVVNWNEVSTEKKEIKQPQVTSINWSDIPASFSVEFTDPLHLTYNPSVPRYDRTMYYLSGLSMIGVFATFYLFIRAPISFEVTELQRLQMIAPVDYLVSILSILVGLIITHYIIRWYFSPLEFILSDNMLTVKRLTTNHLTSYNWSELSKFTVLEDEQKSSVGFTLHSGKDHSFNFLYSDGTTGEFIEQVIRYYYSQSRQIS